MSAATTATQRTMEHTQPADAEATDAEATDAAAAAQPVAPGPSGEESEMLCTLCGLRACWTAP